MSSNRSKQKKWSSQSKTSEKKLFRSKDDQIIGGVAGGLGVYLGVDATIVRIFFVAACFWGGFGLLLYIILWLVMPSGPDENFTEETLHENAEELVEQVEYVSEKVRSGSGAHVWVGVIILLVGVMFFLNNFGLFNAYRLVNIWPLILVAVGFYLLFKDN